MKSVGKPVLIAILGLVAFALLAQFVKAALFGGLVYAWIATALAVHCLMVPEPQRHSRIQWPQPDFYPTFGPITWSKMWCATRARNTSGGRTHLDTCWLGPVANGQFDRVTGWTEAP